MATPFSRSLRSLAADDFRRSTARWLLAALLLALWAAWLFLARVSLYEVSTSAHLAGGPPSRDSAIRAVAQFAPSALARIAPGQPAQVRLDGFPWPQYGSLPATVASVAEPAQDGRVQVELAVQPGSGSTLPLRAGLPGTVEVEVERVAPVTLVLRAAGQALAPAGARGQPAVAP